MTKRLYIVHHWIKTCHVSFESYWVLDVVECIWSDGPQFLTSFDCSACSQLLLAGFYFERHSLSVPSDILSWRGAHNSSGLVYWSTEISRISRLTAGRSWYSYQLWTECRQRLPGQVWWWLRAMTSPPRYKRRYYFVITLRCTEDVDCSEWRFYLGRYHLCMCTHTQHQLQCHNNSVY